MVSSVPFSVYNIQWEIWESSQTHILHELGFYLEILREKDIRKLIQSVMVKLSRKTTVRFDIEFLPAIVEYEIEPL